MHEALKQATPKRPKSIGRRDCAAIHRRATTSTIGQRLPSAYWTQGRTEGWCRQSKEANIKTEKTDSQASRKSSLEQEDPLGSISFTTYLIESAHSADGSTIHQCGSRPSRRYQEVYKGNPSTKRNTDRDIHPSTSIQQGGTRQPDTGSNRESKSNPASHGNWQASAKCLVGISRHPYPGFGL